MPCGERRFVTCISSGFLQVTGDHVVELARSARVIDGTVGGSSLDAWLVAGIDIADNCREGIGGLFILDD